MTEILISLTVLALFGSAVFAAYGPAWLQASQQARSDSQYLESTADERISSQQLLLQQQQEEQHHRTFDEEGLQNFWGETYSMSRTEELSDDRQQ